MKSITFNKQTKKAGILCMGYGSLPGLQSIV